jgi:hypothetical protein
MGAWAFVLIRNGINTQLVDRGPLLVTAFAVVGLASVGDAIYARLQYRPARPRMPLSDRDHAIAVAEQHVRAARVGEPQLLHAERVSGGKPMSDAIEQRLRSLGATDAQVERMKGMVRNRNERPQWEVSFLLNDPRYTDGVTVASVQLDDTVNADLEVFQFSNSVEF